MYFRVGEKCVITKQKSKVGIKNRIVIVEYVGNSWKKRKWYAVRDTITKNKYYCKEHELTKLTPMAGVLYG